MPKPRVAIIGGSGYIGSSVARKMSEDHQVRILDSREPAKLDDGIEFQRCDVRNREDLEKGLRGVDVVIHSAIVQIPAINDQKRAGYDVNILGTQNICEAVHLNEGVKGMILCGTWHTIGESRLQGRIDEEFGFRPDRVEERARLYALSKIAQEAIVRYYDAMAKKVYGVIRLGTVLGVGMSEKTAASIFIEKGLKGERITPFSDSMYRPMLYADIADITFAFKAFVSKIMTQDIDKMKRADHIFNVYYPKPITILDLAQIVRESIVNLTDGRISPVVEVIETGRASPFDADDKSRIEVDISKLKALGLQTMRSPESSISSIVANILESVKVGSLV